MHSNNRPYDITLFGATGFAGRLIAAYLASKALSENFTWAIAGRNREKLQVLADSFSESKPGILIADTDNPQSLESMCRQTAVLMSSVGPYVLYGEPVIKACIASGTHYLDITGEPDFVFRMRHLYSEAITNAQISCIHCCGFDSVPADLGTFLNVQKLPHDEEKSIQVYVTTNATFSSGTIRSAVLGISGKYAFRKHPKPSDNKTGNSPTKRSIHFNRVLKKWCIPMPVIDAFIVQQSASAFPEWYGKRLEYAQFFTFPSFFAMARILSLILLGMLFLRFAIIREYVFKKFESGEGPSLEKRRKSTFQLDFFGRSGTGFHHSYVSGGDPGYDETAKMFSECAFCMLQQLRAGTISPGILSPVQAWGNNLFVRLKNAGLTFKSQI